jgi:hypothetical protein
VEPVIDVYCYIAACSGLFSARQLRGTGVPRLRVVGLERIADLRGHRIGRRHRICREHQCEFCTTIFGATRCACLCKAERLITVEDLMRSNNPSISVLKYRLLIRL